MTIYIVWNEARTEGYATTDAQVAYEARKGADSNCFTAEGEQMKLAQAFCELTGEESCTTQTIDVDPPFALVSDPDEEDTVEFEPETGEYYRDGQGILQVKD